MRRLGGRVHVRALGAGGVAAVRRCDVGGGGADPPAAGRPDGADDGAAGADPGAGRGDCGALGIGGADLRAVRLRTGDAAVRGGAAGARARPVSQPPRCAGPGATGGPGGGAGDMAGRLGGGPCAARGAAFPLGGMVGDSRAARAGPAGGGLEPGVPRQPRRGRGDDRVRALPGEAGVAARAGRRRAGGARTCRRGRRGGGGAVGVRVRRRPYRDGGGAQPAVR